MFFEEIKAGKFQLVVSEIVVFEIQGAPAKVRAILTQLPPGSVEVVEAAEEIITLRDAYVAAGVLGEASIQDAAHVAAASVAEADMIVSEQQKV